MGMEVLLSGMMMYELHLPLVMLANRELQKGPNTPGINREEIKDNLKASIWRFSFKTFPGN